MRDIKIEEALAALSGVVTERYSEAVTAQWKALREERDAEKEMNKVMGQHGATMRMYVRKRLELKRLKMGCDFHQPGFTINHSHKIETVEAYINGEIYLFGGAGKRGRVRLNFSLQPTNLTELNDSLDRIKALLEAYRAATPAREA